jgi:predicted nicotinamide N-methyase
MTDTPLSPLNWPTHTIHRKFGAITVQLQVIKDFDDVLNHCVATHPNDTDMIPYYADLWPSAEAMSQHIVNTYETLCDTRIIELGCGLGLPSILCAKLGGDVTATDFHPDNRAYFEHNARDNDVSNIAYRQLDWSTPSVCTRYDLVIGSDLLYEQKQIESLTHCILTLLAPGGTFILADPGRDHIQAAVDSFENSGFTHDIVLINDVFIITFNAPNNAPGTQS